MMQTNKENSVTYDNISVIAIWYQICIIIIFWQEEPGKALIEKHYFDILPSSEILFVERQEWRYLEYCEEEILILKGPWEVLKRDIIKMKRVSRKIQSVLAFVGFWWPFHKSDFGDLQLANQSTTIWTKWFMLMKPSFPQKVILKEIILHRVYRFLFLTMF